MEQLVKAEGLTSEQLAEIKELDAICSEYEKLNMKLNWDMLESRPKNQMNDILFYQGQKLIGFTGLYGFGAMPAEMEATAMVHPDFRRQGIAKVMLGEAINHCRENGTKKLLLITERASQAGTAFVKSAGTQYSHSEYRMIFSQKEVPSYHSHGIFMRKAITSEYEGLYRLDSEYFTGNDRDIAEEISSCGDLYDSTYIAQLDGEFIGKIGITIDGGSGYIFGFVVEPKFRGRGYGREMLSQALIMLQMGNIRNTILEVAVDNENALTLYKSCGFELLTIYDYYLIGLV